MRLTTKGRFAVTAMIDVAMHGTKAPVTLAGVSQRQKISLSYLEQLFGKLRRHGLVESVRGPGGGYRLARGPGGRFRRRRHCRRRRADRRHAMRRARELQGRRQALHDARAVGEPEYAHLRLLRSVTLAELVAQQNKPDVSVLQDQRLRPPRRVPAYAAWPESAVDMTFRMETLR